MSKQLIVLVGCLDCGQKELAASLKAKFGRRAKLSSFRDKPVLGRLSWMLQEFEAISQSKQSVHVWDMCWTDAVAEQVAAGLPFDASAYGALLDKAMLKSDFSFTFMLMQPSTSWLSDRSARLTSGLSEYEANAKLMLASRSDKLVLEFAELGRFEGFGSMADVKTVQFSTLEELRAYA